MNGEATPIVAVALYLIAALAGAVGQYLYKLGAAQVDLGRPVSLITNPWIVAGIGCYLAVMLLFVAGLRRGGQLTVLYPVYATTFIWSAAIGTLVLGEPLTGFRAVGTALIILGVFFVVR
jgi:drug/metabolite transporter (DMT)-like permease